MAPKPAKEPRMLVARESFVANWGGVDQQFHQGQTRVREDDPRIKGLEHLFEPVEASAGIEQATAAPGEIRDQVIAK